MSSGNEFVVLQPPHYLEFTRIPNSIHTRIPNASILIPHPILSHPPPHHQLPGAPPPPEAGAGAQALPPVTYEQYLGVAPFSPAGWVPSQPGSTQQGGAGSTQAGNDYFAGISPKERALLAFHGLGHFLATGLGMFAEQGAAAQQKTEDFNTVIRLANELLPSGILIVCVGTCDRINPQSRVVWFAPASGERRPQRPT